MLGESQGMLFSKEQSSLFSKSQALLFGKIQQPAKAKELALAKAA